MSSVSSNAVSQTFADSLQAVLQSCAAMLMNLSETEWLLIV